MRILLVDDEREFLDLTQIYLKREKDDLEVSATTSAGEALNLIEENGFDAIVSDYQMPTMNGLEFLRVVRQEKKEDIPFIMFTGKGREEVAMEALNLGADRYLQKGGDPSAQFCMLFQAIAQAVEHYKSEGKYFAVFENTGTATCIIEGDTIISAANREFERLSGYSKQEIEGRMSWTDFVTEEYLAKMKGYHEGRRKERGSVPTQYEFDFVNREGAIRRILLTIDVIPRTEKSVASLLDITDRKELERSLREKAEELEMLLDNIDVQVWFATSPETYGLVNKAFADFLSMDKEELEGKNLFDCRNEEEARICVAGNRRVFESKEAIRHEEEVINPEGKKRIVSVTKSPLIGPDGDVKHVVGTAYDITEEKENERRIERLNSVLRSIRNIDRLIATEKTREEFIQRSCEILTRENRYLSAWILLFDSSGEYLMSASSELGQNFELVERLLEEGELTPCGKKAMGRPGILVIENPLEECTDCPMLEGCEDHAVYVTCLRHQDNICGVLAVSIPVEHTHDCRERDSFEGIAHKIGHAIHSTR